MKGTAALLLGSLAVSAAKESAVEHAATEAVSRLEAMGVDTVQKRAVVGGVAGMVGGLLVKKAQDTVLTCGVIGGLAVAGACYVGWIDPKQVEDQATAAADKAQGYFQSVFGAATAPAVASKVSKSKVILSNLYKTAPGLVVGGAVGSVIGYSLG